MPRIYFSIRALWLSLLICVGSYVPPAQGAEALHLLSVNFGSGTRVGSAAIGNGTNDVWNPATAGTNVTLTNLLWATSNNATGVTLTYSNLTELGTNGISDAMMNSFVGSLSYDTNTSTAMPASLTVSNLPAGTYELYLYALGSYYGSSSNYDNETFRISVAGGSFSGWLTTVHPGVVDTNWTEGVQYVRFTNVVVGSNEVVYVQLGGGLSGIHVLNGLQIIDPASTNGLPALPNVVFDPVSGTGTPASVTLAVPGHGDATIYYTTNGVNPDTNSTVYVAPIEVEIATTIKAFGTKSGYTPSSITTATYPLSVLPLVTFNPADGAGLPTNVVLSVSGHTNVTIYYTTNGVTPTTNSTIYTGAIALNTNGWSYSANRVPTMTDYNLPSGSQVTYSSELTASTDYSWKAFDHATNAAWSADGTNSEWVAIEFPSSRQIAKYAVTATAGGDAPKNWTFEGWNGSSYVVIDTRSSQTNWINLQRREYICTNSNHFKKYRLNVSSGNVTDGNATGIIKVGEIEMFEASIMVMAFATQTNWIDSAVSMAEYHARPEDLQDNHVPTATPQTLTVLEDTSLSITLNGTDADYDPLSYTIVNNPTNGVLTGTAPNVVYLPNTNFFSTDTFTFRVNDGRTDSTTATVNITVTGVNDAPTFNLATNALYVAGDGGWHYVTNFAANISVGPANETTQVLNFVVTVTNAATFATQPTISTNGLLSFQLASNVFGTNTITVALHDNGGTANGGADTSSVISFTLGVQSIAVGVEWAAPLANSTNSAGVNFDLSVSVSAPANNLVGIQYYTNGALMGMVTNSPYSLTWTNPSISTNVLTAVAVVNLGINTTSTISNVKFDVPNRPALSLWLNHLGLASYTNSQPVSTWFDVSLSTNNAVQSNSDQRPVLTTNSINGYPTITYDTSNDNLLMDHSPATNDFWFFAVAKPAGRNADFIEDVNTAYYSSLHRGFSSAFNIDHVPNQSGYLGISLATNNIALIEGQKDGGGTAHYVTRVINSTPVGTNFVLLGVHVSNGQMSLYQNGRFVGIGSSGTAYTNIYAPLRLGTDIADIFPGDIAEVMVYQGSLSEAEVLHVHSYLNSKFALNLTTPSTATGLAVRHLRQDVLELTWNTPTNFPAMWLVEKAVGTNGAFSTLARVQGTTVSVLDSAVIANSDYRYRVKALGLGAASDYSSELSITTPSVSASFPLDALAQWLDVKSGAILEPSGLMQGWQDRITSTNYARQQRPAYRPVPTTNGSLGFYATTNFVDLQHPVLTNNFVYYLVAKAGDQQTLVGEGNKRSAINLFALGANDQTLATPESARTSLALGTNVVSVYEVLDDGNFYVRREYTNTLGTNLHVFSVAYGGNQAKLSVDGGVVRGEGAATPALRIYSPARLGLGYLDLRNGFKGEIFEYLAFNRELSYSEQDSVQTYLNAKYGVSPSSPSTPSSLVAKAVNAGQLTLTWSRSSLNESYTAIERRDTTNGTFQAIGAVDSGVTSFTDNGLISGVETSYRIKAYNLAGASSYSSVVTLPLVALTYPTNTIIQTNLTNTVTLTATASDYDGTVSQVEFLNHNQVLNTDTGSPYSYVWTVPQFGSYLLQVKATDSGGNTRVSTTVSFFAFVSGDTDGDGMSDLDEILAGRNPYVNEGTPTLPGDASPSTGPVITLLEPSNAVPLP